MRIVIVPGTPSLGLLLAILLGAVLEAPRVTKAQSEIESSSLPESPNTEHPARDSAIGVQGLPTAAYERGYQGNTQSSDAEKIAGLNRKIDQDEAKLAELRARLDDPEGEYAKAEADFRRLDADRDTLQKRLQELNDSGDAEAARGVQDQLSAGEKTRKLAQDRFELAITERKTLQERIASIEASLAESRAALAELIGHAPSGVDTPSSPTATSTAPVDASTATTAEDAGSAGNPPTPASPLPPTQQPATPAPPPAPPAALSPMSALTGLGPLSPPTTSGGKGHEALVLGADDAEVSEEVRKARQAALEKAEAAKRARSEVEEIEQRLARIEHRITLEQKQLETCRKRADNASDTCSALEEQFREKTVTGASELELRQLMAQIEEAEARFRQARIASREQVDRLVELQNERSSILSEQLRARHEAEQTQKEYEVAKGYLEELQNPLSPRNMIQWIVDRGPRIVALLLAIFAFRWFMRLSSRRVVPLVASRGARGSREEREDRARTLVGVIENFLSVAILIGGTLMLLETCGIPVMPLLGGAAVVGLAVAFGAQNLVRDYFYGFMILLENQYKINDVVRLGEVAGQVEQITLRMTVLRDLEGNVHFVPNGSIQRVTNMTHGWSRALFEITVAYKEDADHVMAVILDVGKELRNDPAFRLLMLEDPTMLGVDSFGDSGITIKFFIKTRTLKQWDVKREMLRRIKRRFDQLGIEIPFPHRVVYHRTAESEDQVLRAIAEPHILSSKGHG